MFEVAGVLETWELRALPTPWPELLGISTDGECLAVAAPAAAVPAVAVPAAAVPAAAVPVSRLADHRLDYLHYEGPLSRDRGTVTRLVAGTYQLLSQTADQRQIRLQGQPLQGLCQWARTDSDWQLTAHPTSPVA